MSKLSPKYNHKETEAKWQQIWREKEIYKWQDDLPKEQSFVIDTPPPTVSGLLHMGHVFSYCQADFIARYKRMRGFDVFYPIGFDDNGLPTERLVEKTIGKKAGSMERGAFVEECKKVVETAEKEFEKLFNSIALSVDWNQKYQTISEQSQKISQESFIDLYEKGLVERRFEPVLWDCVDQTALAQADLVDREIDGVMNDIVFGITSSCHSREGGNPVLTTNAENQNNIIIIATTRPELLPACIAVMIHPEDARYAHLIKQPLNSENEGATGSYAITALFGARVPIIADKLVQKDKGTGAVMCCTFGDETDIFWWRKYKDQCDLLNIVCVTKDGKIEIENDPTTSAGLKIKDAQLRIIEILKIKNLLINQTKITRSVKCAERSGAPIEILVMPQWFIKILDKKTGLKAKVNECVWHPQYMKIRLLQWIDGLAWDWCISRQRFFGVAFPIWYSKRKNEEGRILLADLNQLPCDPLKDLPRGYLREEVEAETDIMDTWATSSLTPQLSSGSVNGLLRYARNDELSNIDRHCDELSDIDRHCEEWQSHDEAIHHQSNLTRHTKLFPADLRPQAHEIIRTWAFYTIVKSHLHQNTIPWKNLMISGWCLAADKTKMSKSKGNIVTPTDLIIEKGSDSVRYWASTSHLGADTAYGEDVFKIGQKLITKLFNAAKFAALNFENLKSIPLTAKQDIACGAIFAATDLWILSCLQATIIRAETEFEQFEYARAREAIEYFFWASFCDNYLEIVKVRCYGAAGEKYKDINLTAEEKSALDAGQQSAALTIYHCLEALLKLFAPFLPHITEELYSAIFPQKFAATNSIHSRGTWPKSDDYPYYENIIELGKIMLQIIFLVRKFKSDNNISLKTPLQNFTINSAVDISPILEDLKNVCNCAQIKQNKKDDENLISGIML